MVNLLQFVVYFQKWNVKIHPEANVFISQIRKLALFEFIDADMVTDRLIGIFESDDDGGSGSQGSAETTFERRRFLQDDDTDYEETTEAEGA